MRLRGERGGFWLHSNGVEWGFWSGEIGWERNGVGDKTVHRVFKREG